MERTSLRDINNSNILYRKLKGLFRNLYELETELSMFQEDNDIIDSNISDYLDQLETRIEGYKNDIKELLSIKEIL